MKDTLPFAVARPRTLKELIMHWSVPLYCLAMWWGMLSMMLIFWASKGVRILAQHGTIANSVIQKVDFKNVSKGPVIAV